MHKAIFLDRDGVLLNDAEKYYIYKTDDIIINTGVIEALKKFTDMEFLLIVISNQGGIAKQIYTKKDVENILIPLPTLKEQNKIVNRIEEEVSLISSNKEVAELFHNKIKEKLNFIWGN